MTDDEWRKAARYMLDTRTVDTIGEYVSFHWREHAWGLLFWGAVAAVALAYGEPSFVGWICGFVLGYWACHFRSLLGLARSNETLERFVDWSKVNAAAGENP
jgi:hypothetical protein